MIYSSLAVVDVLTIYIIVLHLCLCTSRMRFVIWFFFFQAEDGIRDLVRSRGLGDVYKRQVLDALVDHGRGVVGTRVAQEVPGRLEEGVHGVGSVSYPHLPLPPGDLG